MIGLERSTFLTLNADRIARLEIALGEERCLAKRPPGDPVAVLYGLLNAFKSIANQPDGPSGDEPVGLVPVSRRRAKEIVRAIDHALGVRMDLHYLRAAVARAILKGRDRTTSEVTVRRSAMRQLEGELLCVELTGRRRQSRFNPFQVVGTYLVLTRSHGRREFEYRSLQAMAEERDPVIVTCPVSREQAFDLLAQLYGFKSGRAALRYLIQIRQDIRESELPAGFATDQRAAFLADLPFLLGDQA
jgi:hypothetical protein